MKKVLLWLLVVPMTAQADLLEWLTDKGKDELKKTLPTETRKTVDRLEFAGKQEFRLLKDTTDHVAMGYLGDPSDSDTAARWSEEDKKFYERRREQNVEIALEYAPKFVKDTASFFGSINDKARRLVDFVSGSGSSEFEGDFGGLEVDSAAIGSATRYWEQQAAIARQAEMAERQRVLMARAGETDAQRLARELGLPTVEQTPRRDSASTKEAERLARELGLSSRASHDPGAGVDADQLASQLGVARRIGTDNYTAEELQSALAQWEEQERLRREEEARQRALREQQERMAAEERARREEILREQQIQTARQERQEREERRMREAEAAQQEESGGVFGIVAGVLGAAAEIYVARETGIPPSGIFEDSSSSSTSSSSASEDCRKDPALLSQLASMGLPPILNSICEQARDGAARMRRVEAIAASCPSAAAEARGFRLQYERQAAAACVQ